MTSPPCANTFRPVLPELEQLLVLQDREQKIRQIQSEFKTLPLEEKSLEGQLAAAKSHLEGLKQKAKELEIHRKKLELDVQTRNDTIAKLRTQQYETRKNDEFQAMGNEIKRYEDEIRKIEDEELEVMDQTDKVKLEVATEEKKTAQVTDSINRQMADLETKGKTLDQRLKELATERDQLASQVDEDLLDRFRRLFASKGDAAVVALEHDVCTGCHMKVTTATAVHVKTGKEIVSCEQCGRILYDGTAG